MHYSYIEIEYTATSFYPAWTDLALKLLTQQIYFCFLLLSTSNAPRNDGFIPPACSPLVAPALVYPLHRAHMFLVGFCMWNIITRPSKAMTYFIVVFFASLNLPPCTKRQHPPIRPAPATLPLHHHLHCFHQLRVDCCFFWSNCSHLRPTPPPISLFFDVTCFVAPKKGTSPRERRPSAGCLQRTHRKLLCDDLGVLLPYP